jgi:DNA uptake protein ComE-like DNA-binding protein
MVLFVVVIVITMLMLAGMSFLDTLSTENKAVRLRGDELRVQCVLGSGVQMLETFVQQSYDAQLAAGGLYDNAGLFQGVKVLDDERLGLRAGFSVISPKIEGEEVTGPSFGLTNESARLNVAVLPEWDKRQPGAGRAALLALPGMTEPTADAILDWVDADATARPSGAEASYYAGLGVPYGPRNAEPVALEELLLVRGVTRQLLFGSDENLNYQTDRTEGQSNTSLYQAGEAGGGLPWASLLTVFSAEKNVNPRGKPRINLNEKDLKKLYKQLRSVLEPDQARFIILYRQFGPRTDGQGNESRKVVSPDLSNPGKFTFDTVLDVIGARVELPASAEKSASSGGRSRPTKKVSRSRAGREETGESSSSEESGPRIISGPFGSSQSSMRAYLSRLVDYTTVDPSPVLRGRVNVNRAPQSVLEAVPGLDRAAASRIVAARSGRGGRSGPSDERRLSTWLLTEGIVNLEEMKKIMPYVTAGGDVYRAQVVAFFDHGGPFARAEVVIDATASPTRQVYYKDLRLLGRGYSLGMLGADRFNPGSMTSATESDLFESSSPDEGFGGDADLPRFGPKDIE